MSDIDLSLNAEDILEKFNELKDSYSDIVYEELEIMGKEFKKDLIKETNKAINYARDNGKPSKVPIASSYIITKAKFDSNWQLSKDVKTKSPHFHLLENGHEIVTHKGVNRGFVPGYRMLGATCDLYETKSLKYMEEAVEKMIKKAGV